MMKSVRILLALILPLLTSVPALAQQGPPPPPPPPANDYSPKRWKEFASPEGRFKILFPDTPKESSTSKDTPEGKQLIHFVTYQSFITYGVMFTDRPQPVDTPSEVKKNFDIVQEGFLSGVAQFTPRVVKQEETVVDTHPSRFIQVELGEEAILRSRLVAVKNRLYQIMVIAPKHKANTWTDEDYEGIAMSFLNSFKLIKR